MDIKEKLAEMPGAAKMGAFAVMGLIGIGVLSTSLGLVGKLIAPTTEAGTPQPLPSSLLQPEAPPAEQSPSAEIDSKRVQLWQALQNSNTSFEGTVAEFSKRMREARGQRWYQQAIAECSRMGAEKCPNPYLWLVNQQQQEVFDLRQKLIAGKMGTDGVSAEVIRQKLERIQDIAAALTLTDGTPPIPAIATEDLANKAVEVYGAAAAYEAMRQQDANKAFKGGTDADMPHSEPITGGNPNVK